MPNKDLIIRGSSGNDILSINLEEYLSGVYPASVPPPGCCKITNIYYNPTTEKIVCEYDDIPES